MAPTKAGKRAAPSGGAAASPKKKTKSCTDPVEVACAGIVSTLEEADDLNEHCRQMLVGMLRPSLFKAKSERHDLQGLGVAMVEEALQAHKQKLIEAVEKAEQKLNDMEGSKNAIQKQIDDAKNVLAEKEATRAATNTAYDAAKASAQAAEVALAEAKELQEKADTTHTVLEKERVAIVATYQEHFKAPMDNNQGPNHTFLKPFIETLGFEESLLSALPSSCVKTKEQRGGFDDLVLTELGKALLRKIGAYEKGVEDAALAISEFKEGVASALQAVEDRRLTEKAANVNLEAATAAENETQAKVSKALADWAAFEPQMNEASDNYNQHESKRIVFEDGPLKTFEALREKDVPAFVDAEASSAGA
jgi:chromosome segregation ATPase